MENTLLLGISGVVVGMFGAFLGLGGGVLLVPLLTIAYGLPFRDAVAVSLIGVAATSSASTAVYLRKGVADLRLGMTLELAAGVGAIAGALIAFAVSESLLAAAFAVLLGYTAVAMVRRRRSAGSADEVQGSDWRARRVPATIGLAGFAGIVSAMLGIGGGTVNVPAMHLVMGAPLRIATATSNLMMGVSATAGAVVYIARGAVDPFLAGPIVAGVFFGAAGGSRIVHRIPVRVLHTMFVGVLVYLGLEMLARAFGTSLLGMRR